MSNLWFKTPSDLMQDGRFFGLTVANQRHYLCLLMAKSAGLLDQDFSGSDPEYVLAAREAQIAHFLNVGKSQASKIKQALLLSGLIDDDWQPVDWETRYGHNAYRQKTETSDNAKSNADRQRQYRERKKDVVTDERNACVTPLRNAVTDERNARNEDRNASVTPALHDRNGTVTEQRNVSPISYEEERLKIEDIEVDTESEITDSTTGTSPVVPRAQAHATLPTAPSVDNSEKPPGKRNRKTVLANRLPEGWQLPKDWGDWAISERPDLNADDVRREAACFADYWHAKAGADARKADWAATWRNWIRRAHAKPRASPPQRMPDGSISLVRDSTRQSAELAKQLIFANEVAA